jgi:DNA-binding transcriptional ArsR family regulator
MSTVRPAISHPLSDELVVLIAGRFRALSEPTRIKLLDRLLHDGPATVAQLTEATGTTQQNASKHLGVLLTAGLVSRQKRGNFTEYRIADATVGDLCESVCGSLRTKFESLRDLVV